MIVTHYLPPEHDNLYRRAAGSRWGTLWPTLCGSEASGRHVFRVGPYAVSCPVCRAKADAL